jgi:hypothetical protein
VIKSRPYGNKESAKKIVDLKVRGRDDLSGNQKAS